MESQLELIQNSVNNHYSNWVYEALDDLPENFVITDPTVSGHPIVFASQGCLEMFGYCKEEVVGRNGRMFQGQGTCRRTIMEIREAIREERPIQVNLLNYRKDGTPFWVLFHMSPVFSEEDGRAINFVAVQVPILRNLVSSSRSGFCSCDDGVRLRDNLVGSCRREVCLDSVLKLSHGSALDLGVESGKGLEVEELCEASELEKQKATTCINNILSVLTRYSAFRGKSVSDTRCCVKGGTLANSALLTSLGRIKQSFVLFDPFFPGMPIVYASDAFFKLTGYGRHEVLGCNHRFLSGSHTDESTLGQIKECIQNNRPCKVRIRDYRKDMTSFWNLLHMSPIRNASGKVAYFVEVHMEEEEEDNSITKDGEVLNPELKKLGAIAAVKVAVRSATMVLGSGPGPASSKQ